MSKSRISLDIDKTLKLEGQKLALQETIKKDQRVTLTDIIERALETEIKKASKSKK